MRMEARHRLWEIFMMHISAKYCFLEYIMLSLNYKISNSVAKIKEWIFRFQKEPLKWPIEAMQIKIIMRCHCTAIRMADI